MDNNTTIKDLAKHLNISISSVSRALSDSPGVSAKNKSRVLELAKMMDYKPNTIAQSLKTKKSNTIGIIIPEVSTYFNSSILSGIMEIAFKNKYKVTLCESKRKPKQELTDLLYLKENHTDGILLIPCRASSQYKKERTALRKLGIPIVLIDRNLNTIQDIPLVTTNDFDGAYDAVKHLIEKGYKNIAHFRGHLSDSVANERFKGYKKALKDFGLEFNENHILTCEAFSIEEGSKMAKKLMANSTDKPDAIFTINDLVGVGVIKGLKELNINIPEQVGVIGFSNAKVSWASSPSLTTVHQEAKKMGKIAAKIIFNQINNKVVENSTHLVNTYIIERESTAKT